MHRGTSLKDNKEIYCEILIFKSGFPKDFSKRQIRWNFSSKNNDFRHVLVHFQIKKGHSSTQNVNYLFFLDAKKSLSEVFESKLILSIITR